MNWGDFVPMAWSAMLGSWATSLWIMRKDHQPAANATETSLREMARVCADRKRFVGDGFQVTVKRQMHVDGRDYRIAVSVLGDEA